jgi:hypothetical protein
MKISVYTLLFIFVPAFALAGPPMFTDDTGTPGDGRWEINVAFTVEKRSKETQYETPILDMNYGLGEDLQFKYEVPWLLLNEKGEGAKDGLGNSLIGLKWRFIDEADRGFSASVYPQLECNNPGSSSDNRGLADNGTKLLFPVQLEKRLGAIGVTAEIGYTIVQYQKDEWVFGLMLGYNISNRLQILGEIYGTALSEFEENEQVSNFGAVWKFNDTYSLLASVGRGIHSSDDDEPEVLSFLGIQLNF